MSADMLVNSRATYQVDLVGPARKDQKWQAMAGEGYAAADFQIDWDNQQATCPQGHTNQAWIWTSEKGQPSVRIKFSQKTCRPCPVRSKCTQTKHSRRTHFDPAAAFVVSDHHFRTIRKRPFA